MLVSEIPQLFHVSGNLYWNVVWLAVHSCYLPLVHNIGFVELAFLFAFLYVGLAGSNKAVFLHGLCTTMREVDSCCFIANVVDNCQCFVIEELVGVTLELLRGTTGCVSYKVEFSQLGFIAR